MESCIVNQTDVEDTRYRDYTPHPTPPSQQKDAQGVLQLRSWLTHNSHNENLGKRIAFFPS